MIHRSDTRMHTPASTRAWAARAAALLAGLLLLGGCAGLVPVRVDPRIELVKVDHWLDKKEQGSGRIEPVSGTSQPTFVYTDPLLRARLAIGSHQVEALLENRSGSELIIDWERSYYLDEDNKAASLFVRPGASTVFKPEDEKPRVILPDTKLELRISKHAGDVSGLGATKPLFPIQRRNAETARAEVKASVGTEQRLVLTLKKDGDRHVYHFHLRLVDALIDGKPVVGQ